MNTQERNQQNPQTGQQKQWDERPGQQETDPHKQQQNRVWEEAQQKQQQFAQNPGVGGDERNPSENSRNQDPTRRSENWQEEE